MIATPKCARGHLPKDSLELIEHILLIIRRVHEVVT